MRYRFLLLLLPLALLPQACEEDPVDDDDDDGSGGSEECEADDCVEAECETSDDCAETPETPICDKVCVALPQGWQIGVGDESPSSVTLTLIMDPGQARRSTDLAFNPSAPTELWVMNSQDDSVFIIDRPGEGDGTWERIKDPAAAHFMDKSPAMAFGAVVPNYGQTFGVCGDSDNGGNDFMGPALFTADRTIFAESTPGGLGSHLDMLHSTTFCRGIAHVEASIYFVFNSNKGSLDKYDFKADHGPGNDDHSDGEIYRYVEGTVAGVEGISSHLAFDATDRSLYVADTGNKRIARLDTASGTEGSSFTGLEPARRREMEGATIADVVPAGTLEAPSGIELHEGLLFVSDNVTSRLHAFQLDGTLVRSLDTGLPSGTLSGLAIGPDDGKLYLVDVLTSRVYRIDPIY